jgi:signal transduction histidine kinase
MRTTVDTFVSTYTTTIQEQGERLAAFNRMASHELRSPIGTLLFASTLLDTERVQSDPIRLAKVASTIRTNTERLSWLIENVQRLARLGNPLDVPSEQRLDVAALAQEVARQLGDQAAARGVEIRIDQQLPTLTVDPARLELVLLNLVSNAIKYSDPTRHDRFVEIASGGIRDGLALISVRDNGIGIATADLPAIFERFYRAHPRLDRDLSINGTGLGLAIVAECIEALGGTIRCESTVGQGTTFSIALPARNLAAEANG